MQESLEGVLEQLPRYPKEIKKLSEQILANLVMVSEIPAPTFDEAERRRFLINRFTEYGLHNTSTDEVGNGLGILPGEDPERYILIVAHMDTIFDKSVDHTVTVHPNQIEGPGVGDNSTGLAALVTLPVILDHLDIRLRSNLVLMGSSRSLGKGDIEGIRFFLSNKKIPIIAGLCVEGVEIGRLSYSSIGMMRCEIVCNVPQEYDWTRFGASGSIVTMNQVINRILALPLPKQPMTNIVLGQVEGGTSFNAIATHAILRFEIRSESEAMVQTLGQQIENIVEEVSALTDAEIFFNIISHRRPGGVSFDHPLPSCARAIMQRLGIKHRISPSTSELSAFIHNKIPAITVGITSGENLDKENETVRIEPIFKGISQLVTLIQAIDQGYCDEHR
jgi:acetylornithine deacetylase/succinyl-diaminopimelate desuccinylase-like protein